MKKKFWILTIVAGLVMALALSGAGCSAFPNTRLTMPAAGYAVLSNGGSAVQYANYVYFINGTVAGFSDDRGDQNRWGNVRRGGIARVKLGELTPDRDVVLTDENGVDYKVYQTPYEPGKYFGAEPVETVNFDEDEKKITVLDIDSVTGKRTTEPFAPVVEMVVPKFITFSNDDGAGIFIYDNWIYYASPANRKNKGGTVQFNLTDFFRTRLDGTGTQRLYTSKDEIKSFNFYSYGGKVYLVCFENCNEAGHEGHNHSDGGELISIPIDRKAGAKVTLESDVTEVMFPRKEVYYKGIGEDTASDYVYYTREFGEDDSAITGNIMECHRPDFKSYTDKQLEKNPELRKEMGWQLADNNNVYSLLGAEGDTLFYYETVNTTGLRSLMAQAGIGSERAAETVIVDVNDSMTQIVPFNGAKSAAGIHEFHALVAEGSNLVLYSGRGTGSGRLGDTLISGFSGGTIYKVAKMNGARADSGNDTAFYSNGGALYAMNLVDIGHGHLQTQLTKGSVFTGNNFNPDFAGGMIWFLGDNISQKDFAVELREASLSANYMYIKHINEAHKDADEFFIGILDEKDLPEEE